MDALDTRIQKAKERKVQKKQEQDDWWMKLPKNDEERMMQEEESIKYIFGSRPDEKGGLYEEEAES